VTSITLEKPKSGKILLMEVEIAVAKVNKYATSESGDTVEVIERPGGGLSVVMADGQSSGKGAKVISTMVVRKVITLLSEGVRDGAAARAASDYLFNERKGKVSSTLNIFSVDLQTSTLVITRNNPAPVILAHGENIRMLGDESKPIGLYRDTRPWITEHPLEVGLTAIMFTDGLIHAGSRHGESIDIASSVQCLLEDEGSSPKVIVDSLLEQSLKLDQNRPVDDTSIVAIRVSRTEGDGVRRMIVKLPLSSM
jgi:serine phosphatase RsbU (regulator of sigma subunit)